MRAGVVGIQGDCFQELLLGFTCQPLLQEFAPALDVESHVAGSVGLGQPRFVVVLDLERELAERRFVIVALDPFWRKFGGRWCAGGSGNGVEKTLSFSVWTE